MAEISYLSLGAVIVMRIAAFIAVTLGVTTLILSLKKDFHDLMLPL